MAYTGNAKLGDTVEVLLQKLLSTLGGSPYLGASAQQTLSNLVTIVQGASSGGGSYLPLAGGTLTGAVVLASGSEQIKLGGSTSAFPALGNTGATAQFKLADDSNYAGVEAGLITSQTGGYVLNTTDSASVFAYGMLYKKRGTTGDATAAVATASELGNHVWQAWNGAAYQSCAIISVKTAEAQSSGHAGGEIGFRTASISSGSVTNAAFITAAHNFIIGAVNTLEPTSLAKGLVIGDGTAATADPTTASAIWSIAGELQYRTSGSSEGSGVTNHLHNRGASQSGVGTNYTLTNATARVAFGTTNAEINLPTAGTYLVMANVEFIAGTTAADVYSAKLRNLTDSSDIGVNKRHTQESTTAARFNICLHEIVTVTALKAVGIFAFNETGTRGTIDSTTTDIKYIRLF